VTKWSRVNDLGARARSNPGDLVVILVVICVDRHAAVVAELET
jgi:hypothetical protein